MDDQSHFLMPTPTRAASPPASQIGDREMLWGMPQLSLGWRHGVCAEEQIVHICRKPRFIVSAIQRTTSAICLEGSHGNYRRVLGGLNGKGLKCVGNQATLVLQLMA